MAEPKYVEGLTLTGELIKNMEKKFVILGARYEDGIDLDTKKPIRKMVLNIEINKAQIDYYPNKTSVKVLVSKLGMDYTKWVGFAGEFDVKSQMVGNAAHEVLYIKP
jgi:hypothetical protein